MCLALHVGIVIYNPSQVFIIMYCLFAIYLKIKSRLLHRSQMELKWIVKNIRHGVCTTSSRNHTALGCNRQQLQLLKEINAINVAVILTIQGVINIDFYWFYCSACADSIAWIFQSINIIMIKGCHCITDYLNGTSQITAYLHNILHKTGTKEKKKKQHWWQWFVSAYTCWWSALPGTWPASGTSRAGRVLARSWWRKWLPGSHHDSGRHLKGQCHEIFDPRFFRQSIIHRPQINTLKYFRILFRIRRDIRL
jgi:hypothetical protein